MSVTFRQVIVLAVTIVVSIGFYLITPEPAAAVCFDPFGDEVACPGDNPVLGGGGGDNPVLGGGGGDNPVVGGGGGTAPCDTTSRLCNPLTVGSLEGLLVAILNIVVILMVPIIVFFIIYAGFKYVMAQGNSSQIEEAQRALLYAVIGGVIILGAEAIIAIIENVVTEFQR
ncbi:MAG: hypothetical protein AAGA35_01710 [Patescibacteria group bacterium]